MENNNNTKQNEKTEPLNISSCVRDINYCSDKMIWDINSPQSYQNNYYYIPTSSKKKSSK